MRDAKGREGVSDHPVNVGRRLVTGFFTPVRDSLGPCEAQMHDFRHCTAAPLIGAVVNRGDVTAIKGQVLEPSTQTPAELEATWLP